MSLLALKLQGSVRTRYMKPVGVVILAAGKGTRMRSRFPKVAHRVGGRPMLEHVLRAASAAIADSSPELADSGDTEDHNPRYVVVVGHEQNTVRSLVTWSPPSGPPTYVVQEPQLGTADAVSAALAAWPDGTSPSTILVLYGDTPLVRAETLAALLDEHERTRATLTFLTASTDEWSEYGRILRDGEGRIRGIVEAKHASRDELEIREVNSGIYCFEADWLRSRLGRLAPHENGEYYLTDLVGVAVDEVRLISTVTVPIDETMGVNDRVALAEAEALLRQRTLRELMLTGVTVLDPASTYVDAGVRVGQDTVLLPGTMLQGETIIGENCEIGPNSVVRDCSIGDDCKVLASWLENAVMETGSRIGPMGRLRAGAHLEPGAHLGNFGEVKNSTIGRDVQMHHFGYVGDATVGAGTNIGAGVVTMNYDGKHKHHTEIGEGAFISCDTLLRAPVTIGDGAWTGAGAVVTRDVPDGQLAVGMPARIVRRVKSEATTTSNSARTQDSDTGNVPGGRPAHPPGRITEQSLDSSPESGPRADAGAGGERE